MPVFTDNIIIKGSHNFTFDDTTGDTIFSQPFEDSIKKSIDDSISSEIHSTEIAESSRIINVFTLNNITIEDPHSMFPSLQEGEITERFNLYLYNDGKLFQSYSDDYYSYKCFMCMKNNIVNTYIICSPDCFIEGNYPIGQIRLEIRLSNGILIPRKGSIKLDTNFSIIHRKEEKIKASEMSDFKIGAYSLILGSSLLYLFYCTSSYLF